MISTKYHTFEEYLMAEYVSGLKGQVSTQLIRMYRMAKKKEAPVILELGTDKGCSTTVFLQACEENDGQLVSIDIADCSEISTSDRWTFVQSDSTDIEFILSKAPFLKNGIDLLYIDSRHERTHVDKELRGWYPLLNQGAYIFFDDIDSNPYRKGQSIHQDNCNFRTEIECDEVNNYVQEFFYANEAELYLEMMYGTTGQAQLYKLSPKGSIPQKAKRISHRRMNLFNALRYYPRKLGSILKRKITNT